MKVTAFFNKNLFPNCKISCRVIKKVSAENTAYSKQEQVYNSYTLRKFLSRYLFNVEYELIRRYGFELISQDETTGKSIYESYPTFNTTVEIMVERV